MAFGLTSYVPLVVGAIVGVYVLYQLVKPISPQELKTKKRRKRPASKSATQIRTGSPRANVQGDVAQGGEAFLDTTQAFEGMNAQDMHFYNALLSMNHGENDFLRDDLPEMQDDENAEMNLESMNAAMKFALFQMLKDKSFPMEETTMKDFTGNDNYDDGTEYGQEELMDDEEAQQYLAFLQQYLSANEQHQQQQEMTADSPRHRTSSKKAVKGKKKRRSAERVEQVSEWSDISE